MKAVQEAVVKLDHPFQYGHETISQITIPPIKAKHLRGLKLKDMGMDDILKLLGKVAGMPDSQIDELHISDVMKVSEVLTGFLGGSPETGTTSLA